MPNTWNAKQEYQLVWSDEFDYTGAPDPNKWGYDIGSLYNGWGNNEKQYYTNRLENARVENGKLIITAIREDYEGFQYTSARLVTKHKGDWLYGKVQVRAKIPRGVGTWPAIWMLPTDDKFGYWPHSGEIDIMEHVGFDHGVVHSATHCDMYCHAKQTQREATTKMNHVDTKFHDYELIWSPGKIETFFDGERNLLCEQKNSDLQHGSKAWPFTERFHLLLNIAVGGNWGGMKGINDNIFPQTMEIEHVRVYQLAN